MNEEYIYSEMKLALVSKSQQTTENMNMSTKNHVNTSDHENFNQFMYFSNQLSTKILTVRII